MRRLVTLALLAVLISPGVAQAAPTPSPSPSPTQEAQAGQGVNVTPDPASPHRSKSGTFLELGTVQPGVPVNDAIVVRSTFSTPQSVSLYAADGEPAVGGGFGFSGRTETPTQVGAWLTVAAQTVQVPARGELRVPVRLLVPPGVEGGEYVGAVIAEPVDQGPASAVQTRTRFAMAVYLTVPGGAPNSTPGRGRPDGTLQVVGVAPHFRGDKACPVVHYRNDSQKIVDPQVTVQTKGLLGSGSSYHRQRTGALLPGAEASVPLPCLTRPAGPGSVVVTLSSPKGNGREAIDYRWLPVPYVLALLFLLLLIGALVTTFVRGWLRRRKRAEEEASAARAEP